MHLTEIIINIVDLLHGTTPIFSAPLCQVFEWLLATLGLTFGITHSRLLKGLRERITFIRCPQCVGFWSGMFVFFLDNHLFNLAFCSSFICFAVYFMLAKQIKNYG